MKCNCSYLESSIGRKQIVAVTGLLLIGFIIGHLAGNLFIYFGPEAFNGYAKKLAGLRPGLYVIEIALAWIFVVHMWMTATLVFENIQARKRYEISKSVGKRSLATRLMPYTGTIILIFVVWHLLDFTFIDKHGPRSMINGESYGLYGVVFNSFSDPLHSLLYIVAIFCLGFHLYHGVESFMQTFGFTTTKSAALINKISHGFAILMVAGYSSIPVYVYLVTNYAKF